MGKRTVYAKVVQAGQAFESVDWRPWINVDDDERATIFAPMVLHRWIRNHGGVGRDERLPVVVYYYDDRDPTHKNGKPSKCMSVEFVVRHRDAAECEAVA